VTLPLVLDTDIGTDVDDALALALALKHPDIDLRAVTTVSGRPRRRAHIAAKLLALAGREDVEVAAGLPTPPGRTVWMGHEGEGLLAPDEEPCVSSRDAVTLLLDETARVEGLQIATVGMQTNLAAAIEKDGSLPTRVARLGVMGGVFPQAQRGARRAAVSPAEDHNLNADPRASLHSLGAGMPTLFVPCDVTFGTYLSAAQLDRLRRGDALARALARLIDVWRPLLHSKAGDRLPEDYVTLLHDPLTVLTMVDTSLVTVERLPVTVALADGLVRTFIDPVGGEAADVVTAVDAPRLGAFLTDLLVG
jgi:inosine-uridine nucleoside N-ribohydrolase